MLPNMTNEEAYMQGFNHRCGGMGVDPRKLLAKYGALAPIGDPAQQQISGNSSLLAAGGISNATQEAMKPELLKKQLPEIYPQVKMPKIADHIEKLKRDRLLKDRKPESQTPANSIARKSIGMAAGPYGT